MRAKVYLVGAGPGGVGLMTVRGLEILRQADVVIYDYLVDTRILDEAKRGARLICADSLGRRRHSDGFLPEQEKINRCLIREAKRGTRVVRLKNGDPSLFGRLSQELDALCKAGIPYEVIPGVTAASAAAAFSGIPLTDRQCASSCVFVTGHEDPLKKKTSLDWDAIARSGTVVLYMAVDTLGAIASRLAAAGKGKDTPAAIVAGAGTLKFRSVTATLSDIARCAKASGIKPPAVVIVGDVVRLGKKFDWFRRTKKVLFTGISRERFFEEPLFFHLPLIRIVPLQDYRVFDRELVSMGDYDWIVFASRYGVEYFFQRLNTHGRDARSFASARVACVGTSTRLKLLEFGVVADLTAEDESSRGLIAAFRARGIAGKKIFMPRSDLADKGLTQGLAGLGARVRAAVAYRNIMPEDLPDIDFRFFDEVKFTSPSGVRNFVKRYGTLPRTVEVGCIGHVTRREAKKWRLI